MTAIIVFYIFITILLTTCIYWCIKDSKESHELNWFFLIMIICLIILMFIPWIPKKYKKFLKKLLTTQTKYGIMYTERKGKR